MKSTYHSENPTSVNIPLTLRAIRHLGLHPPRMRGVVNGKNVSGKREIKKLIRAYSKMADACQQMSLIG